MQEPRKQTTEQKQQNEALQTKTIGRDLRFRIKGRPAASVIELVCSSCAQEFHIRTAPQNYFFTCLGCRTIGCLPGVLAAQVDREYSEPHQEDEKKKRLTEIREAFPAPEKAVAPPPQARRQTS